MEAEISRSSSFEVIADVAAFDDLCVAKQHKRDFDSTSLLGASPSLVFYCRCFASVLDLQSGYLPAGLPAVAIYHAFLGSLLRGDISQLHVRVTPREPIKAVFKLRNHETVFTVPLLSADDEKRGVYPVTAAASGKGVGYWKGGHMAWQFAVDRLSVICVDENQSLPEGCLRQMAAISTEKVDLYGFQDDRFARMLERNGTEVTSSPLCQAPRLISGNYNYVDFSNALFNNM